MFDVDPRARPGGHAEELETEPNAAEEGELEDEELDDDDEELDDEDEELDVDDED
jgi:hypothetical protein